jgi:hypothetical protein
MRRIGTLIAALSHHLFAGGVPLYREIFADVAAKGYEGFELS